MVDCVGLRAPPACTAPSLLGIDMADIPAKRQADVQGLLFELPEKVERAADCPQSWIKNVSTVDLWAKEQEYNTHMVNWFRMPDGSMVCSLKDRESLTIRRRTNWEWSRWRTVPGWACRLPLTMPTSTFRPIMRIRGVHLEPEIATRWGRGEPSEKQMQLIQRVCRSRKLQVPGNG